MWVWPGFCLMGTKLINDLNVRSKLSANISRNFEFFLRLCASQLLDEFSEAVCAEN